MHKINSTKSNQTKFFPLQSEDKNILFSLNPEAKEEDGGRVLLFCFILFACKNEVCNEERKREVSRSSFK